VTALSPGLASAFSTPGAAFGSELRTYSDLLQYEYFVRTTDKVRIQWIQGNRGAVWHRQPVRSWTTAEVINLYRCGECGCWGPASLDGTSILNGRL